jgi:hypothetical protein
VIVGKAVASYTTIWGRLKSVQADLSARAIRTDTGQSLPRRAARRGGAHHRRNGGAEPSRGREGRRGQMADKISRLIQEAGGTGSVNITVIGLNNQFVKFKDVLRNQVRVIRTCMGGPTGTWPDMVDCKGSARSCPTNCCSRISAFLP